MTPAAAALALIETTDGGALLLLVQSVAVALTAFIPVLPSEPLVITSGVLAAEGTIPLWATLAVTMVGCLVGDVALYLAFRYRIVVFLHRWRWGRQVHRRILRARLRAGDATTWISLLLIRAMPAGRTASMATAGIMGLPAIPLTGLAIVGSITWSLWLTGLGYITGTTTGLPPWASAVTGVIAGTLVGAILAVMVTRRNVRARRARARFGRGSPPRGTSG